MSLFGMPGVPWLGAVTNIILGLGLIFWPLSALPATKKAIEPILKRKSKYISPPL